VTRYLRDDLKLLTSNPLFIGKKVVYDTARRHAPQLSGRVLDIGCGTQPYRKYTNHSRYVGLETSALLRPHVVGRAQRLPFGEDVFDSVLCTEVLEHVREPRAVLREIARVIKTGGTLYLSVPMLWYLHYVPDDYYRFTRYGIQYLLESEGFEVVSIDESGRLITFIMVRIAETLYQLFFKLLCPLRRWGRLRAKLAVLLTVPFSVLAYPLSQVGDRLFWRDVIDWAVLAKKRDESQ